jgi:hypothetical protein
MLRSGIALMNASFIGLIDRAVPALNACTPNRSSTPRRSIWRNRSLGMRVRPLTTLGSTDGRKAFQRRACTALRKEEMRAAKAKGDRR